MLQTSSYWSRSRQKKNKWFLKIFLPLLLISALIAFVTFYGLNTGNFTIGVDQKTYDKNISISTESNSRDNNKTLYVNSRNIIPYYFRILDNNLDEFTNVDGENTFARRNVIGITFYLKNELSNLAYDIDYTVNLNRNTSGEGTVDFAKVLFIIDEEKTLYHNMETNVLNVPDDYYQKDFGKGKNIVEGKIKNLSPNGEKKITLLFWYEGDQIDHKTMTVEDIESLKLQVVFKISEPEGDN